MSWSDTTPAPTVAGTPPYLPRQAIAAARAEPNGSDERMFGAKQQVLLGGQDD